MIEISGNSLHRIDLLTTKDGDPVPADSEPSYTVYDADSGVELVSGVSVEDTEDVGRYYFYIDSDVTSVDRTIKTVWSFSLLDKDYQSIEYTSISVPYVDREEIITELGLGSEPQDLNYFPESKIRIAERVARLQINNYTGRNFNSRSGSQVTYGMGSDTIIFPERMSSFTKLEQDDVVIYDPENGINTLGYDIELTETGQGLRIKNSSQMDVTENPPMSYTAPFRLRFINGSRYKVYGVLGYPYIPLEVKQAALLLISDNLYNDALWRQKYIAEFDTGQMKVKLRDTAFTGTGNLLADDLLDQFKITGIVVI